MVEAYEGHAAVVAAAASLGAMQVTVGRSLVVGTVHDPVVAQQAGGELAAEVQRVVRAVRHRHLAAELLRRGGRREGHRAAEGSVAVGRRAHAALNLHRTEQRAVRVHVSPEDALVFGRVEGHTVERHIDARVGRTAYAHVRRTRAQSVLAPRQHARRLREEEGQLAARLGKLAKCFLLDVAHGIRCILLRPHAFYYDLLQLLHLGGVVQDAPILCTRRQRCLHRYGR